MKTKGYKNFICDFETLAAPPNNIIISGAFIPFDFEEDKSFLDLVSEALYVKFSVKEQKELGRKSDKYTIEWWKKQSKEAQKELLPTKEDLSIKDGVDLINTFLFDKGIRNPRKTLGWCRGTSFDMVILEELYVAAGRDKAEVPAAWYNYRDIRTYIGTMIGECDKHTVPLPKNILNEDLFTAHNCVHDIAKDILTMQYAEKYAFGELEVPNES